jgi:hypothetical protein
VDPVEQSVGSAIALHLLDSLSLAHLALRDRNAGQEIVVVEGKIAIGIPQVYTRLSLEGLDNVDGPTIPRVHVTLFGHKELAIVKQVGLITGEVVLVLACDPLKLNERGHLLLLR